MKNSQHFELLSEIPLDNLCAGILRIPVGEKYNKFCKCCPHRNQHLWRWSLENSRGQKRYFNMLEFWIPLNQIGNFKCSIDNNWVAVKEFPTNGSLARITHDEIYWSCDGESTDSSVGEGLRHLPLHCYIYVGLGLRYCVGVWLFYQTLRRRKRFWWMFDESIPPVTRRSPL